VASHAHEHAHRHAAGGGRALLAALAATLTYALIELGAGAAFGSLALMSDAGHMFSDAGALGLAAFAAWLGARPAGRRHSYGFARAEVVAAFVNGLAMLLIVGLITVEAIGRMLDPRPVVGLGVMAVAFVGLLVNLFVVFLISRGESNLNIRGALVHVIGDVIGSAAAITAGAVIYFTGWTPIDALLSIFIALLILAATARLLRDALHVLMEGVPAGLRLEEVGEALSRLDGVSKVHDLHVWNISSGQIALSAHVEVRDLENWPALLESARLMLQTRFGIAHVTLQPELFGGINPGYRAKVTIVPGAIQKHRHRD
jgi:cobalt-zinc-cadmium efflux system protein